MVVGNAGTCQIEEVVSPDLLCLPGYTLQPSSGIDVVNSPSEVQIQVPIDFGRRVKKLPNVICSFKGEESIDLDCSDDVCSVPISGQYMVPEVVCPEQFELIFREVDPYNFQPETYQRCRRFRQYKAIAICPPGFDLFGDRLSHFSFG
eukprot:GHVH01006838.1.p1 GENE.GHVH01006838.1~~GHVH01006838.1.p1  ORF type:complete len:148 (+),score=12.16 GHVH01006838.1:345-788(+)